jgi:hypothetical protein
MGRFEVSLGRIIQKVGIHRWAAKLFIWAAFLFVQAAKFIYGFIFKFRLIKDCIPFPKSGKSQFSLISFRTFFYLSFYQSSYSFSKLLQIQIFY